MFGPKTLLQLIDWLFFRWKHYKSYILKTNYFTQVHFSLKTIFYRLMIKLPSQIYFLSIEKVPPIFYYWFTFSGNMHRYETCWSVNDHLNIQTFWIQMYGCFSIRASTIYSWNSTKKNILLKNLSLKNSTSTKIKYFLNKHFIEK